ncbi:MAG: DUF5677 domain-containing protein [Dehalococcoidia bacterium]
MPKFDAQHYLPVESYKEALETFHAVSAMILFEFARQEQEIRDSILCNFVARTDMMMKAIFHLWDMQDYQDCWILYRCLMDRFFHLSHLHEHNQFEVFEKWSFLEQYNSINKVRSDPWCEGAHKSKRFNFTLEQKKRAKALSKNPTSWQRPKAEEVAKRLDMRFLYDFGYDYASMHVHPMANDGLQDFFTITKLEPSPDFPEQRSVLSNTIVVGVMIVQEGLNASTPSWRAIVYDFLEYLLEFVNTGDTDYMISFLKLSKLFQEKVPFCEKSQSNPPRK